jgi:hypothetical protein
MPTLNNFLLQALNEEVKYWVNHNLKNYLEKQEAKGVPANISEIEHIIDYLNSDAAPKRLRKMSYKHAKSNSEQWLAALVKKGANIDLCEGEDYEIVIDFKDGFKLVKLLSKDAFDREGNLMSHCVSSFFGKNNTSIYSLYDARNMPHATLEFPENATEFHQCKGKGNGSIHNKYIGYILKAAEHFNISIRKSEMRYLGYQCLSDYPKEARKLFKKTYTFEKLKVNEDTFVFMDSIKERS